jgi:hypothetical protein
MQRSPAALARLGLRLGEPIRFQLNNKGRWIVGKVEGIEDDGSIQLRDPDGATRSLRAEVLEIRRPGSRGRLRWCIVSDVAVTWEQLEMFEKPPAVDAPVGKHIKIQRDRPTLFDDI